MPLIAASAFLSAPAFADDDCAEKVNIIHQRGPNPPIVISVCEPAVAAHLRHGDRVLHPDLPPDQITQEDRDGDSFYATYLNGTLEPGQGFDCNDDDLTINPGARDVLGNGIDENCDSLVDKVFATVQIKGRAHQVYAIAGNDIWSLSLIDIVGIPNAANLAAALRDFAGQANTTALVLTPTGVGTNAARLCDGLDVQGLTDWYLPAAGELGEIVKANVLPVELILQSYWSSTELGVTSAYVVADSMGTIIGDISLKGQHHNVACVRKL